MFVAAVLVASPSSARAADTTINFDNLPNGTTVAGQYAAQGVTFDQAPFGAAGLLPFTESDPTGAHSPPNVLNINEGGCGLENTRHELWGELAAPRNHVNLFVGDINTAIAEQVTLTGYDLSGNSIPGATQTVSLSGGIGVHTFMSITDPRSQISFFEVLGTASAFCLAIDDFSFDALPSKIAPDFGLSTLATSDTVVAGGSTSVSLLLHRTSTSTGPISLAVSGLPTGVAASINPDPTSGADGSQITLILTAAANAPPAQNVPVTVTGTPSSTAGTQPRSVSIPISVSGTFDLRAQGLDVTQGIQQSVGILVPSGGASGGSYNGVDLVAAKKTVVRFYADAHGAPQGIGSVGAVLHGFRNGVELSDSPIYPAYGPSTLPDTGEADPAPVFQSELESDNNAFTFVLPDSWTSGTLELVGDVINPPPSFSGPQVVECQTPACLANDSFTLNGVIFTPTQHITINTIALTVNGTAPVPVAQVFTDAKAVAPLSDQGFLILPYEATLDVSSSINSNQGNKGASLEGVVAQWDQNNGNPNYSTIGVTPTGTNGYTVGRDSEVDYAPNSSTGNDRPLTSVAHEMFHQFGLPHASNECGGGQDNDSDDGSQTGEPWQPPAAAPGEPNENPPDDGIGQLDGIGLDMTSQPFKILASGLGGISQYFDFMSYCSATIGFGDAGNWVSPQNWEAVFNRFKITSGGARDARARSAAPAGGPLASVAAVHPALLRVIAFVSQPAGVQIASVGPQVGPILPGSSTRSVSSFTLLARARGGRTLDSVPMSVTTGHIDRVGALDQLEADVPSAAVHSIELSSNGIVVARRTRPATAPRVRILAPIRGARVGKRRTVLIRWTTTNPEHLALTASVDYSRDGGRSWRTIFIGANHDRVALPSFYLVASGSARVRVRINDGFNESAATSARFTAFGSPPQASILSPAPHTRVNGDALVPLAGQAFDQQLRNLTGRSLQWFDGPFLLGHGATLAAGPLAPGINHIKLAARDGAGRIGSATITVTVTAVQLPFLRLTIPKRVSRKALKLTLTASSAVPAELTIGRHSFALTTTSRRFSLPISRGRTPLLLHLTVTAHGISTPFAAEVTRS